jgi:mannose/cellobiose epimerase-like protein (N-acyl-D-glucosamine 2-epimerase family)
MHCCEALIAAFEATGERKYLDRATRVARQLTVVLTSGTDGKIWEHYDEAWGHDFEYNRGDTRNKLRPWGYQPGHFTEWAKLLLLINRHAPQPWLLERAGELFDQAMKIGYDARYGGLYYAVAPDGSICGDGKYSWVQAETIAAAAFLGSVTNDGIYWCVYRQLWSYAMANMVDHQLGCWHRNLTRENSVLTDTVAMGRTDYHAFCACVDVSNLLSRSSS